MLTQGLALAAAAFPDTAGRTRATRSIRRLPNRPPSEPAVNSVAENGVGSEER